METRKEIIKNTVMKTLFDMFGNDDNYSRLKKACIPYHHFFAIKNTEYKDIFVLYPVSDEAKQLFNNLIDSYNGSHPYIFVEYFNNVWQSSNIYFKWIHSNEWHDKKFNVISDKDVNAYLKKMYEFLNEK